MKQKQKKRNEKSIKAKQHTYVTAPRRATTTTTRETRKGQQRALRASYSVTNDDNFDDRETATTHVHGVLDGTHNGGPFDGACCVRFGAGTEGFEDGGAAGAGRMSLGGGRVVGQLVGMVAVVSGPPTLPIVVSCTRPKTSFIIIWLFPGHWTLSRFAASTLQLGTLPTMRSLRVGHTRD